MLKEQIEKKIEYFESFRSKDKHITLKLQALRLMKEIIEKGNIQEDVPIVLEEINWVCDQYRQDKFERARKLTLNEKYKLKKQFPKLGGRNKLS